MEITLIISFAFQAEFILSSKQNFPHDPVAENLGSEETKIILCFKSFFEEYGLLFKKISMEVWFTTNH